MKNPHLKPDGSLDLYCNPTQIPCEISSGNIELVDAKLLMKRIGCSDDENERVEWIEYYLRSDKQRGNVHRSAHTTLKKPGTETAGATGSFGG